MPLLSVANQAQLNMLFNVYYDMLQLRNHAAVKFDLWELAYGTGTNVLDLDAPRADPATFGIINSGISFYNFESPESTIPLGVKTMVPWPTFLETHFDTEVRGVRWGAMACGSYQSLAVIPTAASRMVWHVTAALSYFLGRLRRGRAGLGDR